MASAREMRLRIKSVKNISQVTRALEAVSAAKVRKAIQALTATRSYATKAWQVLTHVTAQPGHVALHPLLTERPNPKAALVIVMTADRGLAGAYNTNVIRYVLKNFDKYRVPVKYITVGRKGRDLLLRLRKPVLADFSNLPPTPKFGPISAIGRLVVDEYLEGNADEVYLIYTDFISMARQVATVKKLLPLVVTTREGLVEDFGEHQTGPAAAYEYEPEQQEILDEMAPRFTALQIYQAVLESQASEHAARMIAMRNATENARELVGALQLAYNKVRQQAITNDILDIVGGAEALAAK
ncbi:MAG: ATP synthase F1 subunit gamma [Anaerolineales bacterium]|nr:ATP synthase F1 subunit gamma [Anaerolineales bacterium]NUQ84955.1 ATP synthase F1 subunit gamma [Anaerolineales bacterium]